MESSVGRDDLTVLIFELDGHRFGVRASEIREVTRAVLPTRLAQAPSVVEGVINVRGEIAAVLDMRARFQLPRRPIAPSDLLLICRVRGRLIALRVDAVSDLRAFAHAALVPSEQVSPGALHASGVFTLADGLVFLSDLPSFLSEAESQSLADALRAAEPGGAASP